VRRYFIGIGLVGALVIISAGARPASSAGVRLAVVDMQKILTGSKAGKIAQKILAREKKRFEGSLKQKQSAVGDMIKRVRELQVEIQQKGPILRAEQRRKKIAAIRTQRRAISRRQDELKRMLQEIRRDYSARKNRMMGQIIKQIREVIQEIADEGKYDVILERSGGVIYVIESVDISKRVIDLYNKKKK
jgi:Skp family chaperone for outer membrane proteins